MTTFDYIVDHAQKNVWCTPNQDMQSIVQPARLTPTGGAINTVPVNWRTITLPVQGVRFHVYQIGQLDPLLMGLSTIVGSKPQIGQWQTFASIMAPQNLIVDIYAESGVQMPRFSCWYMYTRDKNLIVAVQFQPTININLDTTPIFLRVFRNAYYQMASTNAATNYILTAGWAMTSTADILAIQTSYETIRNKLIAGTIPQGEIYAFINGYRCSGVDLFTAQIGDCVEYVFDSSIYAVIDLPIAGMTSFTSTLDSASKYLVHYPGAGDSQIDWQGHIDAFLYPSSEEGGRWAGVYYHRNAVDAMRMVTHKDYSIPTAYVAAYATQQPTWQNPNLLSIRLQIRKGGWNRALVFENNRIEELYKMPDADIVQAMTGVNATVPNWTAPVLEASAYAAVMASPLPGITNLLVQQAYGYNAIAKLIGDTPSFTTVSSGQTVAAVPYALQGNCTGFEYNAAGNLIGFFPHPFGSVYPCSTASANLVEFISGTGGTLLDEVYGQQSCTIVPGANYRFYTSTVNADTGAPLYKWTDVTGTSQYTIIGNTVTWLTNPATTYTLVRGDNRFLAYSMSIPAQAGLLEFSLTQQATIAGVTNNIVMQIPMGELYLWLNDKALIEGIDYLVNFPQVVITNLEYLNNVATQAQNITVRFTGFCQSNFSRTPQGDVGFVAWGRLSENNKFDIRDDEVLSIIVGGSNYDRSQLVFAETGSAVTVPAAINGQPYQIRDIIVPLQGLVAEDTYSLRAASVVIDSAVSAYLTQKLPEVDPTTPSVIPGPWLVYSPMMCRIMNDLISGVFNPPILTQQYSAQDLYAACAPYMWLLAFDQTQTANLADPNYMSVQPHNLPTVVSVSLYIWKFLNGVNAVFLNNSLNLSHSINITPFA